MVRMDASWLYLVRIHAAFVSIETTASTWVPGWASEFILVILLSHLVTQLLSIIGLPVVNAIHARCPPSLCAFAVAAVEITRAAAARGGVVLFLSGCLLLSICAEFFFVFRSSESPIGSQPTSEAKFFTRRDVPCTRLDVRKQSFALVSGLALPLLLIAHVVSGRAEADAFNCCVVLGIFLCGSFTSFTFVYIREDIANVAIAAVLTVLLFTPPSATHTNFMHAIREPSWSSALATIGRGYLALHLVRCLEENGPVSAFGAHLDAFSALMRVAERIAGLPSTSSTPPPSPLRQLGVFPPNARFFSCLPGLVLNNPVFRMDSSGHAILRVLFLAADQVLFFTCLRVGMRAVIAGLWGTLSFAYNPWAVFSALHAWAFAPAYSLAFVVGTLLGALVCLVVASLVFTTPEVLFFLTAVFALLFVKVKSLCVELRAWVVDTFVRRRVDRQAALHVASSALLHALTLFAPVSWISLPVLVFADLLMRAVVVPSVCVEPIEFDAACHSGSISAALSASRWQAVLVAADAGGNFSTDATCSICLDKIDAPSSVAAGLGIPRGPSAPNFATWRDTAKRLRDQHAPHRSWMSAKWELVLTSCGHVFHARCLAGWEVALALQQQLPPTSCAVCRAPYASSRVLLLRHRHAGPDDAPAGDGRHSASHAPGLWRRGGRGRGGGGGFLGGQGLALSQTGSRQVDAAAHSAVAPHQSAPGPLPASSAPALFVFGSAPFSFAPSLPPGAPAPASATFSFESLSPPGMPAPATPAVPSFGGVARPTTSPLSESANWFAGEREEHNDADVELVMKQAVVSRGEAVAALLKNQGDVVSAIMDLIPEASS